MKTSVQQLQNDITDAKMRHSEALKDIKRIEKDMRDFNNNKDDKLAELQSTIDMLKKNQTKNSIAVKTVQKELQAAKLEAEQTEADLVAAQEQLLEVESALKGQEAELQAMQKEQSRIKVCRKA